MGSRAPQTAKRRTFGDPGGPGIGFYLGLPRPVSGGTSTDVSVGKPNDQDHHAEHVEEPRDGGPRQVDVSGADVGEEGTERGEQRPQHEDAAGQREGGRVDDAEAGEEQDLVRPHAVADVVEAVQGGCAADAPSVAEPRLKPVLDEPTEEHRLEHADDQRHDEKGHPVLGRGELEPPRGERELDTTEQHRQGRGVLLVRTLQAEVGEGAFTRPHGVDDRAGYVEDQEQGLNGIAARYLEFVERGK